MRPRSFEIDSMDWWKRSGVWIVGILVIVVAVLGSTPRWGCRKSAAPTQAVNNARQIGLALFEFEQAYGTMPDFATAKEMRPNTHTDLEMGTKASNDFFRQLIAAEICQSEAMFYAQIAGTHRPDNVVSGSKALEKGECGFTYFMGATKDCNPARPIVAAPMIPGTDRFDPKAFDGKAVVLRADNSVTALPIDPHGHVDFEGKNLMDPAHPVWQGKPPVIAWPEL